MRVPASLGKVGRAGEGGVGQGAGRAGFQRDDKGFDCNYVRSAAGFYGAGMVRLSDLHESEAAHLRARAEAMPEIPLGAWVHAPPLVDSTVALVSTAGMHRRSDDPFQVGAVDYRIIPGDLDFADIVLSHISANFDRSAFQQDPNIMLPVDRLREMADRGEIGGVSNWHYSFMGALPDPSRLERTGEEVGRMLAADGVDIALLIPV